MSYQHLRNSSRAPFASTRAKVAHQLTAERARNQQPDVVALEFVFDFDSTDQVLYVSSASGPPRHFLLDFWRHAKDGMMFLLGLERNGPWRDPTHCKPNSYVDWVPRNRFEHNKPGATPHPAATAGPTPPPAPGPYDDLCTDRIASRTPMVEIEPGMYELPASVQGVRMETTVAHRPYAKPANKSASAINKPLVKQPVLNTPIDKTVVFSPVSCVFRNPTQADKELASIVKVMKSFPTLHVTLRGNVDGPTNLSPTLLGRTPTARAFQDAPRRMQAPYSSESYGSIGLLMDARAETIKRYLISKGISAKRISCARGQLYREQASRRSVTVIFSN